MTATAHKYQEDNIKLYGRAHQAKNAKTHTEPSIHAIRIKKERQKQNKELQTTTTTTTTID
jgi:hypothetical protein